MEKAELSEIYMQYKSKFQEYANKYKGEYESAFDKANKDAVREELCSGSDMNLGFYCPSPVQDLIVGNVHRGKILKRITKRSKPDMKYGFSEDNKATYICFSKSEDKTEPEWIAQAEYDRQGRIVCYTLGLFIGFYLSELNQEVYTYSEKYMEEVLMWDYFAKNSIRQDIYKLHHDNDGYFTGYESLNDDYWKGHILEISPGKRRKI